MLQKLTQKNSLLTFALAFPGFVYLLTGARTFSYHNYGWDGADLLSAVHTMGTTHPPGFIFYVLIGKIWSYLFFFIPDLAWRLSFMDAFFAVLTLFFFFKTIILLTKNKWAALIGTLSFAFSGMFWSQALIVEVTTVHTFFLSLLVYRLLNWQVITKKSSNKRNSNKYLFFTIAIFGLGITNHLTLVLIGPAILYSIFKYHKKILTSFRDLSLMILYFLMPFLLYLYLPIISSFNLENVYIDVNSWPSFLNYVFAKEYHQIVTSEATLSYIRLFLIEPFKNLNLIGSIIFFLGIFFSLKKMRSNLIFLLLICALPFLIFNLIYIESNIVWVYNVVLYYFAFIFVAIGCSFLLQLVYDPINKTIKDFIYFSLIIVIFVAMIFIHIHQNLNTIDASKDHRADQYAYETIPYIKPGSLLIKASGDKETTYIIPYYSIIDDRTDFDIMGSMEITVPDRIETVMKKYPKYKWPPLTEKKYDFDKGLLYLNEFLRLNYQDHTIYFEFQNPYLMNEVDIGEEHDTGSYVVKKISQYIYQVTNVKENET